MQSRRLLIVGGSVIGVILLLFAITALFSKKPVKPVAACESFLKAISVNNNTGSYAMLSSNAKKGDTADAWTTKVYALYNVYANATITADGKDDGVTNSIGESSESTTQKAEAQITEYKYIVSNSSNISDVRCSTVEEGGQTKIEGFVSNLRAEE